MRFAVDAWDPGYGSSDAVTGGALPDSTARVDVSVEVPAADWRPLAPAGGPDPPAVIFVDGVRRVDARVWIDTLDAGAGAGPAMGVAASLAAGAVRCCKGRAELVDARIRRVLATASADGTAVATAVGTYHLVRAAGDADRPVAAVLDAAVTRRLAEMELDVALQARAVDELVVVDGPLRGRTHLPHALGHVKTQHVDYLPPAQRGTVVDLPPGARTPAFLVGTTWERHTWYLRLPGSPAPAGPWSGVVRVECAPDLPVEQVSALADLSARILPRHASTAYKDPRAPANLTPVGGLERRLRHLLGDRRLALTALRRSARPAAA